MTDPAGDVFPIDDLYAHRKVSKSMLYKFLTEKSIPGPKYSSPSALSPGCSGCMVAAVRSLGGRRAVLMGFHFHTTKQS